MKKAINEVVNAKGRLTASLLSLRKRMFALVWVATLKGIRPRKQARLLREMALRHLAKPIPEATPMERKAFEKAGKGRKYGLDTPLLLFFVALSSKAYKAIRGVGNEEERKRRLFDTINPQMGPSRTEGITKPTNTFEAEIKELVTEDTLELNRNLDTPKVFYLCSWHGDCAEDHLDYQGKMYIDKDWRKYVTGKETRKAINIYISKFQVRTLQWVMNRPAWLITRPNCRHYFVAIPTTKVVSGTPWDTLLGEYGMKSAVGKRGELQTIWHRTDKGWYTKENVKSIIRQYEERLECHMAMYQASPSAELERAIQKDKMLIRKWKAFLARMEA